MSKDFKNYKNVKKEGSNMKLNIKVDKRELEETLDLLKQIKEEVIEINELMSEPKYDPFDEWKEQINIKEYDPFCDIARLFNFMEVR